VGAAGSNVGAAIWISRDSGAVNEGSAHVAYNPARNEYLVVWHAFTDGLWHIWCQRLSASGQMLGTNRRLSTGGGNTQNARVAYSTQRNEYVVVWQDGRSGSRVDVYAQRLDGTASPLGANFAISTATGSKGSCSVAYGSHNNGYMVIWGDTRAGSNIFAQRLNATAGLMGGNFAVSAAIPSEIAPVLEYDHVNQEYLGAWWRFYDARDWDIYAGRVSAAGYPIGSVFGVATVGETQSDSTGVGEQQQHRRVSDRVARLSRGQLRHLRTALARSSCTDPHGDSHHTTADANANPHGACSDTHSDKDNSAGYGPLPRHAAYHVQALWVLSSAGCHAHFHNSPRRASLL